MKKKATPPTDDAYYVSAEDVADKILERLQKNALGAPFKPGFGLSGPLQRTHQS
jgi:hypothetical protein